MADPTTAPAGYVTIADAADILGGRPWDVVRLIDAGRVDTIQFVSVESLMRHQARGAA